MKFFKQILTASILLGLAFTGHSQDPKEILTNKDAPLIFYGIDFTKAKLIGDANANTLDIVERQFTGINDLLIREVDKYNMAGALRRSRIPINLNVVRKRNESINDGLILSSNTSDYNFLKEADIKKLISGFEVDDKEKSSTGLVLIVDGMNKSEKRMSAWVTFFNPSTKKVIFTERIEGAVGMAFSFRNYWAGGVKNIIDKVQVRKYKEWITD